MTDNKLALRIKQQLPSYLSEEGPRLVAFMEAYYEFMDQQGEVNEQAQRLLEAADVDKSFGNFVEYFNREILKDFPKSILADRTLLFKKVKELYNAKGSELAYKLLFKLLYDEDITIEYPKDYILKTSDGRWVKDTIIKLSNNTLGNAADFAGQKLFGVTSGAEATVLKVESTVELGVSIFTCYVSNIQGEFLDDDQVTNRDQTIVSTVFTSFGGIRGVEIVQSGAGYRLGDTVIGSSSLGGTFTGIVRGIDDTSVQFTIEDGGSGYKSDAIVNFINYPPGTGAAVSIDEITFNETISTNIDTISSVSTVQLSDTPFGAGNPNFAAANVNSVIASALTYSNTDYGTITSISQERGIGYNRLPDVTIIQPEIASLNIEDGAGGFKGKNAVISSSYLTGSLVELEITNKSGNFIKGESITIQNLSRNSETSVAKVLINGVSQLEGAYRGTRGFLSWDNKLQDSTYYQKYSYVINSSFALEVYRKYVENILHPIGHKLFGEKRTVTTIGFSDSTIHTDVTLQRSNEIDLSDLATISDVSIAEVVNVDPEIELMSVLYSPTMTIEGYTSIEKGENNQTFIASFGDIDEVVLFSEIHSSDVSIQSGVSIDKSYDNSVLMLPTKRIEDIIIKDVANVLINTNKDDTITDGRLVINSIGYTDFTVS